MLMHSDNSIFSTGSLSRLGTDDFMAFMHNSDVGRYLVEADASVYKGKAVHLRMVRFVEFLEAVLSNQIFSDGSVDKERLTLEFADYFCLFFGDGGDGRDRALSSIESSSLFMNDSHYLCDRLVCLILPRIYSDKGAIGAGLLDRLAELYRLGDAVIYDQIRSQRSFFSRKISDLFSNRLGSISDPSCRISLDEGLKRIQTSLDSISLVLKVFSPLMYRNSWLRMYICACLVLALILLRPAC